MHEDAPKMSIAQSLAASTSQPKGDIVTEIPLEFAMSSMETKSIETTNVELKITYVDPTTGKFSSHSRIINSIFSYQSVAKADIAEIQSFSLISV